MKVLFLAPQPFFQERGTPIAVRLALEVMAKRKGDEIDLLTYHEGADVQIEGVRVNRIPVSAWLSKHWLHNIGPGISFRKLACDFIFLFAALRLVCNAKGNQYNLVHAVEESVFVAALIRCLFGIPYIYDMDSSIALQLAEKWWLLKPLSPLLSLMEKLAVRFSTAVVPVCDSLAIIAKGHGARSTTVLSDISLLGVGGASDGQSEINLRKEAGLGEKDILLLYIGNLESYQGIDLMIDAFGKIASEHNNAHLVIIGGRKEHISAYNIKAEALGIASQVHLLGPRSVSSLNDYLCQADILVSPRTQGNNTPMKIYSYLHSGVPVLATRLYTHTQVLNDEVAKLAEPKREPFAKAMSELVGDSEQRARIGKAAHDLAERKYTFEQFKKTLNAIYDSLTGELKKT